MKAFNLEVFDGGVSGTSPVYTSLHLAPLLGSVEKFFVHGFATQVSGTTPSINIKLQHSNDGENWVDKVNLGTVGIAANTVNPFSTSDNGSIPSGAYVRLAISMGLSDNNCNLRLLVTGRAEEV